MSTAAGVYCVRTHEDQDDKVPLGRRQLLHIIIVIVLSKLKTIKVTSGELSEHVNMDSTDICHINVTCLLRFFKFLIVLGLPEPLSRYVMYKFKTMLSEALKTIYLFLIFANFFVYSEFFVVGGIVSPN